MSSMDRAPPTIEGSQTSAPLRIEFDGFLLDEDDARLSCEGSAIPLPPKALAVLCVLVRHAGRLVSKDALLDAVWGHRHVSESVLKSTISQVRAALGDDVRQPRFVETASRHGYRFVAAVRAASDPSAIPCDPASRSSTPFVGRDAAMRRLDRAWTVARHGQRRLVWITGEAGIGKTMLINQWLQAAEPETHAHGHCVEPFGAGEPYLPVLEALASLCRSDPRLPQLLRQFAPTWLLQLPWLQEPGEAVALRALLSGAGQDRMLRELCELLEHASRERPILLVLEDLHWSDVSTVRLLDYLARRRGPASLLLVGTFRPTDLVASDHPLKHLRHELRVQGLCEEIALDTLSERDVADWLRDAWPGAHDEQLAVAVHAHTDGLPVFLVNVIDDLRGRAAGATIDAEACRQALALRVPESLGGVIGKQLARLSARQQAMLRAASVRGHSFSQRCVAALLSMAEEACMDELVALARSSPWIAEAGADRSDAGLLHANFRFRHALYQQAIYAELGTAERMEAHLRLAQDLARRAESGEAIAASELAMHFERGQSPGDALRWQAEAAAKALTHLAPQEADEHVERGLRLLSRLPAGSAFAEHELSLRVTRGVAAAQRFGVGSAAALGELERARALSEALPHGPQHTWLMNGLGWTYFSRGDLSEAARHGQAMVRRAEQESDAMLALCAANLMGAARAYGGHLDEAQQWLDSALEMLAGEAVAAGTVRTIVDIETSVHVYRAQVLAHRGLADDAASSASTALARARDLGQPMSLCLALRCACMLAIRTDDPDALSAAAAELRDLAIGQAVAQSIGPARWYHGWAQARNGQHEAGLHEVRDGLQAHLQLGMATGCALAHGYAGQICLWQGDAEAARSWLRDGLALAQSRGESLDQSQLHRLMAQVEAMQGNVQLARAAERRAKACAAGIGAAWGRVNLRRII